MHVPGPERSIGYVESEYPMMNDAGLTMSESTVPGRIFTTENVPFMITGLMHLAFERCTTPLCAIETMGSFGEKYGFRGEEGGNMGSGESLTIADGKDAWVFHIISDGYRGAVWAAQRVPDGHLAVSANNFIIRTVQCDNPDFRCSTNVNAAAIESGLWKASDGPVDFAKAYGEDMGTFLIGGRPLPKYVILRTWRLFNLVAPSLQLAFMDDALLYPFSVKVDKKLSHRDVMRLTRDHYGDTPFDMTVGYFAGPFGNPNRMDGGAGMTAVGGQFQRAISQPSTNYAQIGQVQAAHAGQPDFARLWYAADQPISTVYVPFFPNSHIADAYMVGNKLEMDRTSAWWGFNVVSNWMEKMWNVVYPEVDERIERWQDRIDAELPEAEKNGALEAFGVSMQSAVAKDWWAFFDHLLQKYNDGFINTDEKLAQSIGLPAWWLQMGGFNDDITAHWCAPTSKPPSLLDYASSEPVKTDDSEADSQREADRGVFESYGFIGGFALGSVLGMALAFILARSTITCMAPRKDEGDSYHLVL
eukprot:GEMP01025948.1.p1 GENE.GEMP01025948.1~~GEMP01025948.1.p1  ORF type:complete len:531 (+),score=128.42 GEMP01025948.1:365-1957(+)